MQVINKIKEININKKLIFLLVLFFVILFMYKVKTPIVKENKKDNFNNKQFAIYVKENKEGEYTEYKGNTLFPIGYYLNEESYCKDNKNQKTDNTIKYDGSGITVESNKTVYCTLYFEKVYSIILEYDNSNTNTDCTTVQCALDELYEGMKHNE